MIMEVIQIVNNVVIGVRIVWMMYRVKVVQVNLDLLVVQTVYVRMDIMIIMLIKIVKVYYLLFNKNILFNNLYLFILKECDQTCNLCSLTDGCLDCKKNRVQDSTN